MWFKSKRNGNGTDYKPASAWGHVVKGKHLVPMVGVFNMEGIEVKNY